MLYPHLTDGKIPLRSMKRGESAKIGSQAEQKLNDLFDLIASWGGSPRSGRAGLIFEMVQNFRGGNVVIAKHLVSAYTLQLELHDHNVSLS